MGLGFFAVHKGALIVAFCTNFEVSGRWLVVKLQSELAGDGRCLGIYGSWPGTAGLGVCAPEKQKLWASSRSFLGRWQAPAGLALHALAQVMRHKPVAGTSGHFLHKAREWGARNGFWPCHIRIGPHTANRGQWGFDYCLPLSRNLPLGSGLFGQLPAKAQFRQVTIPGILPFFGTERGRKRSCAWMAR